jgi:hypothetical protein
MSQSITPKTIGILGDFALTGDSVKAYEYLKGLSEAGHELILITHRAAISTYRALKAEVSFEYHDIFDSIWQGEGFPKLDEVVTCIPTETPSTSRTSRGAPSRPR